MWLGVEWLHLGLGPRHRMVTVRVVQMVRVGFGLSVELRWTIGVQKADYFKTNLNKS